jgi:hypothetical protein
MKETRQGGPLLFNQATRRAELPEAHARRSVMNAVQTGLTETGGIYATTQGQPWPLFFVLSSTPP